MAATGRVAWRGVQTTKATHAAITDVAIERDRQEQIGVVKREQGIDWRSCADPEMAGGDDRRLVVLTEEVGEVARAILESGFVPRHLVGQVDAIGDPELRDELVQVAAVAVAWIEAIDARRADG